MSTLTNILVILIAVLHIYILYLEMFAWTKPLGLKVFRNDAEFAERTKVLAANQGLYNGFLAAGLIWSIIANGREAFYLKIFFLTCVFVAGIYGGVTANKKILKIQALPAFIALIVACFGF